MPVITSGELKTRHRQVRDDQPEGLRVRIHRAISWLARAQREAGDPDATFIFLCIALNAAYEVLIDKETGDMESPRILMQIGTVPALDD